MFKKFPLDVKGYTNADFRKACEKFRYKPVSVMNFLEGTRFTPAKHAKQQSPYTHLLKPKAGGVAFVLAALGEQLDALLDVTIVYPGNKAPGFWDLLNGSISRVIIDIQVRELDPALWAGDYEHKGEFWSFPTSTSVPKPVQAQVPVWIAARAPITYDYAVKHGCNIMSWPLTREMSEAELYMSRMAEAMAERRWPAAHNQWGRANDSSFFPAGFR
mgnify:CR=1 FL=1